MSNNKKSLNGRALKSGFWYTINSFLTKGLSIITVPIFSRILTQREYGIVNNFNSWLSVLTIVASLNLYASITRAKIDYEEDIDTFISSILILSTISVIILYGCTLLFQKNVQSIMGMDIKLISYMFFYIIFSNAFNFIQTKHKAFLKYKSFTIISFITVIISVILSLILVSIMKEKYFARILGITLPIMFVGLGMFFNTIKRSKKIINLKYWKYALVLSIPLILHLLAGNILSQFDRIAIAKINGFNEVALYGMAYNVASLLSIVWTSFNGAWIPWFYEKMKVNNFEEIRKVSKYYINAFMMVAILLLAFSPEIMIIMAPSNYYVAIYVIPPVLLGFLFQFMYSLYTNIEFYHKKTMYIPIGTVLSAIINIVLNIIFIPKYGYIAAAYTTLVGYMCLFIFHYFMVKYLFKDTLFNIREISKYIIIFTLIVVLYTMLYKYYTLRYLLTIILVGGALYINKNLVVRLLNLVKMKLQRIK